MEPLKLLHICEISAKNVLQFLLISAGTSPALWTRGLAFLGLAGTRGLASFGSVKWLDNEEKKPTYKTAQLFLYKPIILATYSLWSIGACRNGH